MKRIFVVIVAGISLIFGGLATLFSIDAIFTYIFPSPNTYGPSMPDGILEAVLFFMMFLYGPISLWIGIVLLGKIQYRKRLAIILSIAGSIPLILAAIVTVQGIIARLNGEWFKFSEGHLFSLAMVLAPMIYAIQTFKTHLLKKHDDSRGQSGQAKSDDTQEGNIPLANGLSTKRALALGSLIGTILAFLNIIIYLLGANQYEYNSGITITKFFSSLSVTILSLAMPCCDTFPAMGGFVLIGSFVATPVVVCIFIGWIIILLARLISPKKNIAEAWFITILIIAYLVINVVEYLIIIPRNSI